jgi:thiol-disulfide isomerase/thioredoxin
MKNKYIFLILIILIFWGCREEHQKKQTAQIVEEEIEKIKPLPEPIREYNFFFKDIDNQIIKLKVKKNHYIFENIKQPIVLINFFASWCPPCIGQLPHLNKLQEKHKEKLYILGLLMYDEDLNDNELDKFLVSQKINFFVSKNTGNNVKFGNFIAPKLQLKPKFSLPLMILFVKGKYYTHYEGSIPEEMIESDIKQALNQIKGQ